MAYVKALHIIFVVTWFAGLFYIVRLFVYAAEANAADDPERRILLKQFSLMQRRLWFGITWPSAVLTFIFGHWVLLAGPWRYLLFSGFDWLTIKYILVWGLLLYHLWCHRTFRQQQRGVFKHNSTRLRIMNEGATIFLIAIVFLVVVKSNLSLLYGVGGLLLIGVLLMTAIYIYKRLRA